MSSWPRARLPSVAMMEGREMGGGTWMTVRIIHSGRANSGLIPRMRTSWSGMNSRMERAVAAVKGSDTNTRSSSVSTFSKSFGLNSVLIWVNVLIWVYLGWYP